MPSNALLHRFRLISFPTLYVRPTVTKYDDQFSLLQRWLYYREHLKYVWNVYCVVTDHTRDLHTTATTGNEPFPIGHGTNYFHFVLIFSLFTSKQLLFLPIYFTWRDVSIKFISHGNDEFVRRSFQFAMLRSRNFSRHSSSIVGPHKPNPLVVQKILARTSMLSEMKTSRLFLIFLLSSWCRYMESWSPSRRVASASEFFLTKLERLPGCGPQHWSWGTTVF